MYKYLPKAWKLRIVSSLALVLMLTAGLPLLVAIGIRLLPMFLPVIVLAFVGLLLARLRR